MKEKIIFFSPVARKETEEKIKKGFLDWNILFAQKLYERIKKYDVECWNVSLKIKKEIRYKRNNILYRVFPCFGKIHLRTFSFSCYKALKKEFKSDKKVYVNLHTYHSLLAYATLFLARNKKNVFIFGQDHGDGRPITQMTKRPFAYLAAPYFWCEELAEYMLFPRANAYFIQSEAERKDIKNKASKSFILKQGVGVDFKLFYPENKIEARKQFKLPINKKILLFVGKYMYYRRPDMLIKIAPALRKKGIVLIAAGGRESDMYYADIKSNLDFVFGVMPQERLRKLYSAADAFIFFSDTQGSQYAGIGVAPLEAMACNTPVISTNLHLMKNYDEFGVNITNFSKDGVLDAIYFCFNHINKFKNIRDKLKKRFSWDLLIKNITNLLEENKEKIKEYF